MATPAGLMSRTSACCTWKFGDCPGWRGISGPEHMVPCLPQVLKLDDETVSSVSAGGFASAAVTGAGRLYMWGTLLQKEVRSRGVANA
jgi:hypothetical protein